MECKFISITTRCRLTEFLWTSQSGNLSPPNRHSIELYLLSGMQTKRIHLNGCHSVAMFPSTKLIKSVFAMFDVGVLAIHCNHLHMTAINKCKPSPEIWSHTYRYAHFYAIGTALCHSKARLSDAYRLHSNGPFRSQPG